MKNSLNNPKHNYTRISNKIFRDKNLTLKELGLLCLILSLPDHWNYTIDGIASLSADGECAVNNCIKKLVQKGYLRWEKIRRSDGKYETLVDVIDKYTDDSPIKSASLSDDGPNKSKNLEEPRSKNQDDETRVEKPRPETQPGKSNLEKPAQKNTDHKKTQIKKNNKKTIIPSIDSEKKDNHSEPESQNERLTDCDYVQMHAWTQKRVAYEKLCESLDEEELKYADKMIQLISFELSHRDKACLKIAGKYLNGREASAHLIRFKFEEVFAVAKNSRAGNIPLDKPPAYFFTALDNQLKTNAPDEYKRLELECFDQD